MKGDGTKRICSGCGTDRTEVGEHGEGITQINNPLGESVGLFGHCCYTRVLDAVVYQTGPCNTCRESFNLVTNAYQFSKTAERSMEYFVYCKTCFQITGEYNKAAALYWAKSKKWIEFTFEQYWELLGAVPPVRHIGGAFLMGEAYTHDETNGQWLPVYLAMYLRNGKAYGRMMPEPEFEPEVRADGLMHRSYAPESGEVKRAWIRNADIPAGQSATGRINCPCDHAPESDYRPESGDVVCACGTIYAWNGWIKDAAGYQYVEATR